MNLHLNFVLNYDMANGNYRQALKMFEHILDYIIDNHAFAYYFAAKCCKKLDMPSKFQEYKAKYVSVKNESGFWKRWIDFFGLEDLDD
jgi:tetratricopeptide (TPR) repeat protein